MFGLKRIFQRTPTKQNFAQKAIRRLQEARPGTEFIYDEGMFHVRYDGQSIINLQNVYLDYCQVGRAQRVAVLEQFVQGMLQPTALESFEEVRSALLPVVRAVAGLDMSRILAGMSKRDEDLFVEFAIRYRRFLRVYEHRTHKS